MLHSILCSTSKTDYKSLDLLAEAGAAAARAALANHSFLPIPVAKERTGSRDTKGPWVPGIT